MPDPRTDDGQASVELVALLPLLVLVVLLAWQAVVAGQALWLAGSAAREAARARALGDDPQHAASRVLPGALQDGLTVARDGDGVRVRLRIPSVVGSGTLATLSARARMEPQA
ncbi:MAG TPA: TadE/TadG family type IV pilus assembly protein [Baekduia sp.]|nr:TadE/TadG family type IV pilus assembly protein [Baekduia sp.]